MRKGRDYSIYLSQKTFNKKISNKSTPCPTCGKKFARLDVHLRCSATCKQQFGEPTSPTQSGLDPVPPSPVQLESTQTSSNQYLVASANNLSTCPQPLPPFKMPNCTEQWEEVGSALAQCLVPAVICATSPEENTPSSARDSTTIWLLGLE